MRLVPSPHVLRPRRNCTPVTTLSGATSKASCQSACQQYLSTHPPPKSGHTDAHSRIVLSLHSTHTHALYFHSTRRTLTHCTFTPCTLLQAEHATRSPFSCHRQLLLHSIQAPSRPSQALLRPRPSCIQPVQSVAHASIVRFSDGGCRALWRCPIPSCLGVAAGT